jgi:hypothetical protein
VEVNPFDTQVGGSHYKGMTIQPLEFAYKNNLNVFQSNVVKYTCRAPLKGDPITDIDKAIHYLQMWKETLVSERSGESPYSE